MQPTGADVIALDSKQSAESSNPSQHIFHNFKLRTNTGTRLLL